MEKLKKTIGGERLGSGNKMTVDMRTYNRSTHDLGYIWRSTMASGTLVPFMSELALPGDTFDIDLQCEIMTHPSVGPLFGSYKVQLDIFQVPMRLYIKEIQNNKLNVGLAMKNVKIPQMRVETTATLPPVTDDVDAVNNYQQIDPSCILAYLGVRGLGHVTGFPEGQIYRSFNAIPLIAYWDIYKNYYANKQEEVGYFINGELPANVAVISNKLSGTEFIPVWPATQDTYKVAADDYLQTIWSGTIGNNQDNVFFTSQGYFYRDDLFNPPVSTVSADTTETGKIKTQYIGITIYAYSNTGALPYPPNPPKLTPFDLTEIDMLRDQLLASPGVYYVNASPLLPIGETLNTSGNGTTKAKLTQQGLGIKTYQSDLFNNWMKTEWIEGTNGINQITAIDTSDGSFTIDTLNLSKKVYDMLNRVALSGGTYEDWVETVYTQQMFRRASTPMYLGGLIKELVFQEVISNSAAETSQGQQPLGQLAGRGVMSNKHKGGKIVVKVDEPSYIMGIISLTPRVDYSQGNKWDMNLKTFDDLHKPALDEIGFQDLITDQMHWGDTIIPVNDPDAIPTFKSAGKQPAWMNYMTNVNRTYGNFALPDNEMFMTLNRRYEWDGTQIKDLTTYIDPAKYNFTFAETALDAQNFWVQIGVENTARRVMSAKVMPNL